jgi:hypothetical protein
VIILCGHQECRRVAVAYTTLEQNPRPWGPPIPEGALGAIVNVPLWYACTRHSTSKHTPLPEGLQPPVCEFCGESDGVTWVTPGSAYHYSPTTWDIILYGPSGLNPNRDSAYCLECAERDREYWAEMWKDYRSSQGI